jgi:2-polyprenyl-3-methyl-5-hydroxy-6-metoxy-1,4-benzoquinol methylase
MLVVCLVTGWPAGCALWAQRRNVKLFDSIHFLDHELCPWWFAYIFDNPVRRLLHKPERVIGPYVKEGMTALDIGCGMGHFSIGMAKLVGDVGKVISVDLQQKMLDKVRKRAERSGVAKRISLRLCRPDDIGVSEPVDFALTFWMAHEVTDQKRMFEHIRSVLKDGGKWMLAEPRLHTSAARFENEVGVAQESGFRVVERPAVTMSFAAVLEKAG